MDKMKVKRNDGDTVDTRILAEKFMPKTGPLSLGGRLICGTVFEVVYF